MTMESYYESNSEHKLTDVNASTKTINSNALYGTIDNQCTLSDKDTLLLPSMSSAYSSTHHEKSSEQPNLNTKQSLSSQVMKYYYQYAQSFNSNKYRSILGSDVGKSEYHWENQKMTSSKLQENQKIIYVHKDIATCMDTIHKKQNLIRPPLIGLPSQSSTKKNTTWNEQMIPSVDLSLKSSNEINSQYELKDNKNDNGKVLEPVCLITESGDRDIKIVSPTSSIASQNKPLEWDSLADVGYYNTLTSAQEKTHSIFHLTESELSIRDLNTNLTRLNPEGTTITNLEDSFIKNTTPNQSLKPNAHSTRIFDDGLELKKDMEIISSINSNAAVMVANDNDKNLSSRPFFVSNKINRPYNKLLTRKKKHKLIPISILFDINQGTIGKCHNSETLKNNPHNTLKRNASMHELVMPLTPISLKRSQSELNLKETINYYYKNSPIPFNFLSSSSITTIINKPSICDKNIQTNLDRVNRKRQESKATQSSSIVETNQIKINNFKSFKEPPSEKLHERKQVRNHTRETAILEKTSEPFLHKESNCRNLADKVEVLESNESFLSGSQEEADGGRASNSFEYFPGHVYRNLPHEENISHRSIEHTERSHSTIPNTSSSLDEKLWGDSDSLLRDLERSLNILKSLINTNKYDKQVKKRLIHHVIKRLVTARYTDDKIEHNLEENVPWNPDDARNKIYCTEIIQALAKKQNHDSTEESLENWKLNRRDFLCNKTANQSQNFAEMMNFASNEDSDAFEERITDKTDGMQDGRKARLGLRISDKYNRPRRHHKYQTKDHTILDTDKSCSSECFLPQSQNLKLTEKDLNKPICSEVMKKGLVSSKLPMRTNTFPTPSMMTVPYTTNNVSNSNTITTTTSTSTTVTIITSINTTPFTPTSTTSQSSNNDNKIQSVIGYNDVDWRLPATISERRFKYEKKAKLGTMSQLINYVEIEKKNQLLWINDEINHLLNLKQLLEEPTKVQKHEIKKKKYYNVVSKNEIIKDQWSSHGNLVTVGNKKNISPKKTKNDYTQTVVHDGVQFFDDKDIKIVNEFNTHSQTNQSDSQESLFFKTSNQHQKNRNSSNQLYVVCSPFQDIGTQTVEVNLINKDVNDQIQVITQLPINSKKETKNILNDKCKSESPITVGEDQEIFNSSKNHCYGCLCGQIKRKPSTFNQNQDKKTILNMPKISCNCDIHQTEDKQIERKTKSDNKLQICQDGTRCQKCGIIRFTSKNKKCQCTYSYKKSVAYELCFEPATGNKCNYESAQLKDYLKKNKPNFVDNVEVRKRCMMEISQLRQMKREKIMQLLALASPSNPIIKSKVLKCSEKLHRKINKDETKTRLRSKYSQSNEKRNKCKRQEKSDQLRHNYLMAKIFCKKLQQKVLQGQVTLSQSISVISNL